MGRRSYDQYCSVARALDLVGDRWTLLIVRELLIGPRRYTDLLHGMPGIGTNHLADRLKRLARDEIVRKRELAPPAASSVYELTARGRGLEPVVLGLARWGLELLSGPDEGVAWRPEWTVVALRGRFDPAAARRRTLAIQFDIDGCEFWARIDDGELETALGRIDDADLTLRADRKSFLAVAEERTGLEEAMASGGYEVEGNVALMEVVAEIFPATRTDRRAF